MPGFSKGILFIIVIILAILSFATAYNFLQISNLSRQILTTPKPVVFESTVEDTEPIFENSEVLCGKDCQAFVKEEIAKAVANIPTTSKSTSTPLPKATTSTTTTKQTTYIPISSAYSTTNTDWTDVSGSEVYIDPGDYGVSPTVTWEASIKIANANGNVLVRLYDDTNKIAVNGSELSSSLSSYTTISSGNLPFWRGKNKYKVQLKSQTSEEATFGSGRIKVVY